MPENMADTAHLPVRTESISPGYWRVTLDSPPFNLYDPELEAALAEFIGQLEANPDAKVGIRPREHRTGNSETACPRHLVCM